MNNIIKKYYVYIDDNAHYMMDNTCTNHGVYDSYKDALNACKFLVEDSVQELFDYDYTEEKNLTLYLIYGITPWFDPQGEGKAFNAREYARVLIKTLFELRCFLE